MAKKKKILKYKKPIHINIGSIVFIIIFIYLVFYMFTYFTQKHVSIYEVEQGAIASNHSYTGLVLRQEHIYNSETSGYVNYFHKDATKIGYGQTVYSVDEDGSYYNQITENTQNGSSLNHENLNTISESINEYILSYSDMNFSSVYNFKTDINAEIAEALSLESLDAINNAAATADTSVFHVYAAAEPGIIEYYTDGYESITTDTFTSDMFQEINYNKQNLKSAQTIEAGSPAYKLITSEYWNILIPIDKATKKQLKDVSNIKVRFLKDETSAWAETTLLKKDGQNYLSLLFKNSVVRFAGDRYLDIELAIDENDGLKIPNSSIIEKEFYVVPKEYFLAGEDSGSLGLLVKSTDSKSKETTSFVNTTLYYETDDAYYVEDDALTGGTTILKPDSSETYTLKETAPLQGVYCINKGYAVFKQIDVKSQNEEYTIVKSGTSYGISLYDHIALDGTSVSEGELVN